MWIFTPTGFVSVVADFKRPEMLKVRAHSRGEIEKLFPLAGVQEGSDSEYRFSATLPRCEVGDVMLRAFCGIGHASLFDAVTSPGLAHAYRDVWLRMRAAASS